MKPFKILLISIVSILLLGCSSNPKYINLKSKPSDLFYTNEIYTNIKEKEDLKVQIFDTNVYKYFDVSDEEKTVIPSFIDSLGEEDFGVSTEGIDEKTNPRYKLILTFKNSKYIINIYNKDYATISPWDGVFQEDTISMKEVPISYNLYEFCEYTTKKALGQLP